MDRKLKNKKKEKIDLVKRTQHAFVNDQANIIIIDNDLPSLLTLVKSTIQSIHVKMSL